MDHTCPAALLSTGDSHEKNIYPIPAFAPDIQPELWSADVFRKIFEVTKPGGILVTYSSKGIVKRALREAGFIVSRLKGPKGKRHVLRAVKELL